MNKNGTDFVSPVKESPAYYFVRAICKAKTKPYVPTVPSE